MPSTLRNVLLALAFLPVLVALPASAAVDDEPYPKARVTNVHASVLGNTVFLNYKATHLTPDVEVKQKIFGCGGKVIGRKHFTGKTGTFHYQIHFRLRHAKHRSPENTVIKQPDHKTSRSTILWVIPKRRCH